MLRTLKTGGKRLWSFSVTVCSLHRLEVSTYKVCSHQPYSEVSHSLGVPYGPTVWNRLSTSAQPLTEHVRAVAEIRNAIPWLWFWLSLCRDVCIRSIGTAALAVVRLASSQGQTRQSQSGP